jgi:hypothetical protein
LIGLDGSNKSRGVQRSPEGTQWQNQKRLRRAWLAGTVLRSELDWTVQVAILALVPPTGIEPVFAA